MRVRGTGITQREEARVMDRLSNADRVAEVRAEKTRRVTRQLGKEAASQLGMLSDSEAVDMGVTIMCTLTTRVALLDARVNLLVGTLRTIQQWDCLNPPDPNMCHDHPWLKRLVDDALARTADEEPTEAEKKLLAVEARAAALEAEAASRIASLESALREIAEGNIVGGYALMNIARDALGEDGTCHGPS